MREPIRDKHRLLHIQDAINIILDRTEGMTCNPSRHKSNYSCPPLIGKNGRKMTLLYKTVYSNHINPQPQMPMGG